ncbi:MAG: peptidylprolyl isomerase [Planctomycetales bacterium]|nr:peptidylprolyl isomerase [Planctomycetales bacterium]
MQIAKDKVVTLDYTLTDDDGQILDSSEGRGDFVYLHGASNIIPGLESALDGKSPGDACQVVVAPADAYGERVEELVHTVSRENFADIDDLEVGMQFRVGLAEDEDEMIMTVVEIGDDAVTLDGNHDLAGMTLHFDVAVRDVRDATAEEIDHGHVHGPGGHHHH